MNVESKLWKLVSMNTAFVAVIQKASNEMRTVSVGKLPSVAALAAMSETAFDKAARDAFHGA